MIYRASTATLNIYNLLLYLLQCPKLKIIWSVTFNFSIWKVNLIERFKFGFSLKFKKKPTKLSFKKLSTLFQI